EATPEGVPPSPASPAVPGASRADVPDEGIARALRGEYEVRIGDWLSRGWSVFTRAGGLFIAFSAVIWAFFHFALPILFIVAPMMMAGLLVVSLIARRSGSVDFSDFWRAFNDFLPLFLAWIVSCAFLVAGLLTCGIVTVYLWIG